MMSQAQIFTSRTHSHGLIGALLLTAWILAAPTADAEKIILGNAYYPEHSGSIFWRDPVTEKITAEVELVFNVLDGFAAAELPLSYVDVFIASAYIPENSENQVPQIMICGDKSVALEKSDLIHPKLRMIRKEVLLEIDPECPEWLLGIGYIMDTADIYNENIFPAFTFLGGVNAVGSLYSDKNGLLLAGLTIEQLATMLPNDGSWPPAVDTTTDADETIAEPLDLGFKSADLGLDPVDLADMPPCTSNTNIMIHAKPNQPTP